MVKLINKSKLATVIGSLVVASLLASTAVSAQEGPRGKRGGGNGDPQAHAERKFERLDTSGDAVISLDEFTANTDERAERRFNRKDADDDGFLTLEEATTGRRGRTAPDHSDIAEDIVACVAELAAEDDSIVVPDADRFQSPEDKFNSVDTSGDGMIDLAEAQAAALDKATSAHAAMDTDEDGGVTLEEFMAAGESRRATRSAVRECIDELTSDDIV